MADVSEAQSLTGESLWASVLAARTQQAPKLRAIAGFVIDSPAEFIRMTSREICAHLGTSEPTLIRFCQGFGYTGLADFRIELALALAARGSALAVPPQTADRRLANPQGKRRIARAALGLLSEERSLLVDNGSTVEAFSEVLGAQTDRAALTVMTSGLTVAQNVLRPGLHQVLLTGGLIQPGTASLGGRQAEASLSGLYFDSLIMGADSIDTTAGLSTYSEAEAHLTRAMVDAAARVIVLADHSKFRSARLHRICGLSRVSVLVTDQPPPEPHQQALGAAGVRLVIAGEEGQS